MFYFAYGSNLDSQDFHLWCNKRDKPDLPLKFVTVGILRDYALDFTYQSESRKCYVADIISRHGEEVEGAIFSVTEDIAKTYLDAKEGVAIGIYRRLENLNVETANGMMQCFSYGVVNPTLDKYPSPSYLNIIVRGAEERGLSQKWIAKLKTIQTEDKSHV